MEGKTNDGFRDGNTWEREGKSWRSFKEFQRVVNLIIEQKHVKDGNDADDKIFVAG